MSPIFQAERSDREVKTRDEALERAALSVEVEIRSTDDTRVNTSIFTVATPSSITTYFARFFVIIAGFFWESNTLTRPTWSRGESLRVIIAPEGTATAKRICDARNFRARFTFAA